MGLRKCLKAAKEQVQQTKAMLDKDDPTRGDKMQQAAERAARERVVRVEKALKELKKLQANKATEKEKDGVRTSTTDPEARVMRMADNGYRPAFNMQLAVDTDTRAIVGVSVTNS